MFLQLLRKLFLWAVRLTDLTTTKSMYETVTILANKQKANTKKNYRLSLIGIFDSSKYYFPMYKNTL